MEESHKPNGRKRKQKRSHAQMVKKFARQRDYGNGLDQEMYQYMINILDMMYKDFSMLEDKRMFVQNVYNEIEGREIECARNQVGSRVIDFLLKYASLENIQKLLQAFEPSLRQLINDKFASHVLQKIIMVCADRGNRDPTSTTSDTTTDKAESKKHVDETIEVKSLETKYYNDIVLKLSKYMINNMEEFVFDVYANHILRTVIQCLGGLIEDPNSEENKKFATPYLAKRRPVLQEYKNLLIQGCDRLQKWPQFCQFGREYCTSGLVQCVLYSLKDIDTDLTKIIIKKIRTECFKVKENEGIPDIFNMECSIRVLEACLMTAQPKTFKKLYHTFFAENLKYLCTAQNTNFSVQRLLDYCITKEHLEEMFDKISEHFPEILEQGYNGILASAGNACLRLQVKQGAFVNAMIKLLKCDTSEKNQIQFVRCIVTLKNPAQLEAESNNAQPSLNLHGSLIIQAILNFNKPIKIINSLLEMNSEELLRLFSDPKGSRILDAFVDSKYVGEKSREKLFKKLGGTWVELAKSTHGSRCLDKMWTWTRTNQQKILIMEELVAAGESLRSTKSGRIISMKLNVPLYARSKNWSEMLGKEEKTKTMFASIIG